MLRLEMRGGLLPGLSRFGNGVAHAYTYRNALAQLRRDDVDRFLLTFYGAAIAYGMSPDTYSSVEVARIPYGINELALPRTYSGTQQLRTLRMMLVKDERNDLWLAFGTP